MGGYFAGIIDTTVGNIQANDASQTGLRYALIVSPKSLEAAGLAWRTSDVAGPAATATRWDGLTATTAMNAAEFPAAKYCYDLTYPADAASRWYLPALDELELLYRNFKPGTAGNRVTSTDTTFPGAKSLVGGYNPSSDPTGPTYVFGSPAQTALTDWRSGGTQAIGTSSSPWIWTSTKAAMTSGTTQLVWYQAFEGSFTSGAQEPASRASAYRARPVRRLVL